MASSIAGIGGTMLALADTTRGIEWRKEDMALREITERQRALENRNRAVDGMLTQALSPLLRCRASAPASPAAIDEATDMPWLCPSRPRHPPSSSRSFCGNALRSFLSLYQPSFPPVV